MEEKTKKLEILVIEDKEVHQESARFLLKDYKVTIVGNYDEAMDLLVGGYQKEKQQYDVVLSDLMIPQGRGDMQTDKSLASETMPFGFPIALIAAKQGVPYVAVVTDMNHHEHPLAYTFDFLKTKRQQVDKLGIENTECMFFDERDVGYVRKLVDGRFTRDEYCMPFDRVEFPEEIETAYIKEAVPDNSNYPEGFGYVRKPETFLQEKGKQVRGKNWKLALERLLKGNPVPERP